MMMWIFLTIAILCEVVASLVMRFALNGDKRAVAGVVVGYVLSLIFLNLSLIYGMGVGVSYGTWTAVGIVATSALSWKIFGERFNVVKLLGLTLITVGVGVLFYGIAVR